MPRNMIDNENKIKSHQHMPTRTNIPEAKEKINKVFEKLSDFYNKSIYSGVSNRVNTPYYEKDIKRQRNVY